MPVEQSTGRAHVQELLADLNGFYGDMDHIAFCRDATALVDSLPAGLGPGLRLDPADFEASIESLTVEGNRATATGANGKMMVMTQEADGRWYLSLIETAS